MEVVIIGNGIAGNSAAVKIRELDAEAKITIVSSENQPHYSACALPYYIAGEIDRKTLFLKENSVYKKDNIKIILGQSVTGISPEDRKVYLDKESLPYDSLILATGSQPIMPPIEGIGLDGVFPLKSIANADQILSYPVTAAAVVGSGPVGIETAIALHSRGVKVYIIELLDTILSKVFDEAPSLRLRQIIEENGIEVFTGEQVKQIAGNEKVEGVVTDKRRLDVDMVIMATGMRPNTNLAVAAGIKIGKLRGIEVAPNMETSISGIYACGDCAETYDLVTGERALILLWHNAIKQAEVAAQNCCGNPGIYPGSMNITSVDIFGTHAVSMGVCGTQLEQLKKVKTIEGENSNSYNRLIYSRQRMVGAQVIGGTNGVGAFLYAIIREDEIENPQEFASLTASTDLRDRLLVRHTGNDTITQSCPA
ncbi:NAD(P)/FAD-dependent oxidoreductase [Chloroflexota bacterium]